MSGWDHSTIAALLSLRDVRAPNAFVFLIGSQQRAGRNC